MFIFYTRSNDESFARGATSKASHNRREKRRIVSLKICYMGWVYETLGIISTVLTPTLRNLGFHNLHFPDVILMFVVIPFLHLMNDEDTKTIITEQNWYQGLRHMLGIYNQVAPE